jgi:integrase
MAKRGQGEGSISKRPDGTWWARITVGKTPDGKQKRKAFYGKTRKEVQEKLTAALNDINNNIYIEPNKMTVGQWTQKWLKDYKRNSIKPTTYSAYECIVIKHIVPELGLYKLKSLRNDMVQHFVNNLVDRGIRTSYIVQIVAVLKSALEQAVDNGLIMKNPAKRVEMPLKQEVKRRVLTVEEQKKLMEVAKGYRYGNMILLMLGTGLRIGEAMGLTWSDIDFESNILSVNRTYVEVAEYVDGKCIHRKGSFQSPKSRTSKRTIPLLPSLVNMLLDVKSKQEKEKQEFKAAYQDSELVFCGRNGEQVRRASVDKTLRRMCKKTGIEHVNPHALRHTFATRGLENGVDLKVMQEFLGHASIKMTADIYTHVSSETKRDSMMKLADTIKL